MAAKSKPKRGVKAVKVKTGYSINKPAKSPCYTCRIWDSAKKGYREFSTGVRYVTGDDVERASAKTRADEIYQNWIAQRKNAPPAPIAKSSNPLDTSKLALEWLESQENILAAITIRNYSIYVESHLSPAFPSLLDITVQKVREYYTRRLKKCLRQTICHELSCLRQLVRYCVEMNYLGQMPEIPNPPRRAIGTKSPKKTRVKPDAISPEEIDQILAKLPEAAPRIGIVRARFILMAEQALRPGTIDKLSVPEHWTPGASELTITGDIMKTRDVIEMPLTAKARAALEEAYAFKGKPGIVFGQHDYREYIEPAAKAVLDERRASRFCAAHLRSAAISNFLDQGASLASAMRLANHKRASTCDGYIRHRKQQLIDEFRRQGRL